MLVLIFEFVDRVVMFVLWLERFFFGFGLVVEFSFRSWDMDYIWILELLEFVRMCVGVVIM